MRATPETELNSRRPRYKYSVVFTQIRLSCQKRLVCCFMSCFHPLTDRVDECFYEKGRENTGNPLTTTVTCTSRTSYGFTAKTDLSCVILWSLALDSPSLVLRGWTVGEIDPAHQRRETGRPEKRSWPNANTTTTTTITRKTGP